MKIAVLAWGSLVWDPGDLKNINGWHPDGPFLPIEFVRISSGGRLTLVIYPGSEQVQTLWAMMDCKTLREAAENLRRREQTIKDNIGLVRLRPEQVTSAQSKAITDEIKRWAEDKRLDAVIWTDLSGNFADERGKPFDADNVIEYLTTLKAEEKQQAEEYIRKTPLQTKTKMRQIIEKKLGWTPSNDTNMPKNIAIKCTYNNGDEGPLVGFNGTCSEDIIKWNIDNGRVWCSKEECDCRKYYDRGFKGKRPENPCMESLLFQDWEYGAGMYHSGKRAGTPIHLSKVGEDKIAILTTRFPGDEEIDRKIIGFFKIAQVTNNPGEQTELIADKKFRIRLPLEEAKELYLWDYYSTKGGAIWGSLLIRYLDDEITARILSDIKATIRDKEAKKMIGDLLNTNFKNVILKHNGGPRSKKSGNREKRIAHSRKYGPGGEGPDHKKLKEWVAKNPDKIGITGVKETHIEYRFVSGDMVDVLFNTSDGKSVVLEIETTDPLPGGHQALKYRTLRCAELNKIITSQDVEAVLVAWAIPEDVKEFCRNYKIKTVEKTV